MAHQWPHLMLAGVAALVLSVNPNLTEAEVRNIIESTAQKVNPNTYFYATHSSRTNGTWNNQMGHGLVDAYAAVLKALYVSGPTTLCSQGVYTIDNLPLGATVTWQVGSGLSVSTSQNTATVTATGSGISSWIKVQVTVGSKIFDLPQKNIWVGSTTSSITGPQHVPNGGNEYYYAIPSGDLDNVSYQWSITPTIPFTASGPNMDVNFPYTNADYSIKLTTTNSCGSTVKYHYIATGEYEPDRVYPNPSSDMVYVNLNGTVGEISTAQFKAAHQVSGELYDYLGNLVTKVTIVNGKASFSVGHLSKGVYILKINASGQIESHRIVVN